MYTADVQGFLKFVQASPSAFHAVAAAVKLLEEKGFAPLKERDSWQLVPGGKYYVTRNLSSLIAFTVPTGGHQLASPVGIFTAPGIAGFSSST